MPLIIITNCRFYFTVFCSTQGRSGASRSNLVVIKFEFFSKHGNNYPYFFRTCAWGTYKPDPVIEDKPEGENPETENPELPELAKPKDEEEYEFIVSGALGQGNDNPEVKVWKVVNEKVKNIHTLTGHSLGIVSVDISPNGKCE